VVGIHQLDLDRCVSTFKVDGSRVLTVLSLVWQQLPIRSDIRVVTPHRDQNDCKMTTSYGEDEDNFVDSSDGICGK